MKQFRKFLPHDLDQKLSQHRRYQRTLNKVLPQDYKEWVAIGEIDERQMTLVVSRQAIAGNLRFFSNDIIAAMRAHHGLDIRKIMIRVSPDSGVKSEQRTRKSQSARPVSTPAIEENKARLRKLLKRL
jgi:hypothetical protein